MSGGTCICGLDTLDHTGPCAEQRHVEDAKRLVEGDGWATESLAVRVASLYAKLDEPVPMLLWCPECRARHVDEGEFVGKRHHTHACQSCGHCWRPAVVPTVGVRFLPGFKNEKGIA